MFLAGDSILKLKDSGELKVMIREFQEAAGGKKNKTRHLEWGVNLRSWRAETDHADSGVRKMAGGLSSVMSDITQVLSAKSE